MPVSIKQDCDGFEISAWHSGPSPEIPKGYRPLKNGEETVKAGDLVYNVIGRTWEPLAQATLDVAEMFGGIPDRLLRFPPCRKI